MVGVGLGVLVGWAGLVVEVAELSLLTLEVGRRRCSATSISRCRFDTGWLISCSQATRAGQ